MASKGRSLAKFVSTTGVSTVADLNVTRANITGVSTVADLNVTRVNITGVTTSVDLNVTRVTSSGVGTFGGVLVGSGSSIGIGTDNAEYALHVIGSTYAEGVTNTRGVTVSGAPGATSEVTIGKSTEENFALLDFVGDSTYSDYGLRIMRGNGGANTYSTITHQGTGSLQLNVSHAGSITFRTSNTEVARIDSSGRLLVGTDSARNNFFNTSWSTRFQVEGTSDTTSSIGAICNSNDVNGPTIQFAKSRGTTVGSNTVVQSGDSVGYIGFQGSDGTDFVAAASISAAVDGTPGADDMPGRLVFSTTADGDPSPTEQLRITSDRYVRLASGTGGIQFNGDTAAANALDDYEEGTWTPAFAVESGAPSWTYTSRTGRYVKIGRFVWVYMDLVWSARSGTGNILTIDGFPYSPSAGAWTGVITNAVGVSFNNWGGATNQTQLAIQTYSGSRMTTSAFSSGSATSDTRGNWSMLSASGGSFRAAAFAYV